MLNVSSSPWAALCSLQVRLRLLGLVYLSGVMMILTALSDCIDKVPDLTNLPVPVTACISVLKTFCFCWPL